MKKLSAILALVLALSKPSYAEIIECQFTSWEGGTKGGIAESWVGARFRVDTEKNVLQIGSKTGWYAPYDIKKVRTSKEFTTYSVTTSLKNDKGGNHVVRYSYRIYNDGRATGRMRQDRFLPLTASGTC